MQHPAVVVVKSPHLDQGRISALRSDLAVKSHPSLRNVIEVGKRVVTGTVSFAYSPLSDFTGFSSLRQAYKACPSSKSCSEAGTIPVGDTRAVMEGSAGLTKGTVRRREPHIHHGQ
jgi:hypothetical protein